jgi:hypothetical protein
MVATASEWAWQMGRISGLLRLGNLVPKLVPNSSELSRTPRKGSNFLGQIRCLRRLSNPAVAGSNPAGGANSPVRGFSRLIIAPHRGSGFWLIAMGDVASHQLGFRWCPSGECENLIP